MATALGHRHRRQLVLVRAGMSGSGPWPPATGLDWIGTERPGIGRVCVARPLAVAVARRLRGLVALFPGVESPNKPRGTQYHFSLSFMDPVLLLPLIFSLSH